MGDGKGCSAMSTDSPNHYDFDKTIPGIEEGVHHDKDGFLEVMYESSPSTHTRAGVAASTRSTTSRTLGRWNIHPSSRVAPSSRGRQIWGCSVLVRAGPAQLQPQTKPSAPGFPAVGRQPQPGPQLLGGSSERKVVSSLDSVCLPRRGGRHNNTCSQQR